MNKLNKADIRKEVKKILQAFFWGSREELINFPVSHTYPNGYINGKKEMSFSGKAGISILFNVNDGVVSISLAFPEQENRIVAKVSPFNWDIEKTDDGIKLNETQWKIPMKEMNNFFLVYISTFLEELRLQWLINDMFERKPLSACTGKSISVFQTLIKFMVNDDGVIRQGSAPEWTDEISLHEGKEGELFIRLGNKGLLEDPFDTAMFLTKDTPEITKGYLERGKLFFLVQKRATEEKNCGFYEVHWYFYTAKARELCLAALIAIEEEVKRLKLI